MSDDDSPGTAHVTYTVTLPDDTQTFTSRTMTDSEAGRVAVELTGSVLNDVNRWLNSKSQRPTAGIGYSAQRPARGGWDAFKRFLEVAFRRPATIPARPERPSAVEPGSKTVTVTVTGTVVIGSDEYRKTVEVHTDGSPIIAARAAANTVKATLWNHAWNVTQGVNLPL